MAPCSVNRALLPTKIVYFFLYGGMGCFFSYQPVYLRQLGLSPTEVAIIMGAIMFLTTFIRPLVGSLADKIRAHKAILATCSVISGVLLTSLLLIPSGAPATGTYEYPVQFRCGNVSSTIKFCPDMLCPTSFANATDIEHLEREMVMSQCTLSCPSDAGSSIYAERHSHKRDISSKWISHVEINEENYFNLEISEVMMHMDVNRTSSISPMCFIHDLSSFQLNGSRYNSMTCNDMQHTHCQLVCSDTSQKPLSRCQESNRKDTYGEKFGRTFWLVMVVCSVGCAFYDPCLGLLDACIYQLLGNDRYRWGKQSLWGTAGLAIAGVTCGFIMDMKTTNGGEISYVIPFVTFCVFQIIVGATTMTFKAPASKHQKNAFSQLGFTFKSLEVSSLLTLLVIFGVFTGVYQGMLFWHLQLLGATQLNLGLTTVATGIPEIIVFFLAEPILKRISHVHCLYLACLAYIGRFLGYSFLSNPWWVVLPETLHGLTYSLMYASVSGYASLLAPPGTQATMQSIIRALHFGIARGMGSVLGGMAFEAFGGPITFQGCAGISALTLLFYMGVQFYLNKTGVRKAHTVQKDIPSTPDEKETLQSELDDCTV